MVAKLSLSPKKRKNQFNLVIQTCGVIITVCQTRGQRLPGFRPPSPLTDSRRDASAHPTDSDSEAGPALQFGGENKSLALAAPSASMTGDCSKTGAFPPFPSFLWESTCAPVVTSTSSSPHLGREAGFLLFCEYNKKQSSTLKKKNALVRYLKIRMFLILFGNIHRVFDKGLRNLG